MKLLLLVAALATFAAASSVFRPGEEYIYHYKGQVLSGIPKASKQYAGLFIDTLVVLQFHQNYKVAMKLEKIKLYKINNKISTEPNEPLQESDLTQLTGEQAMVLGHHLVKPLKFRYDEGEVREIETESEDKYWSINIKKGILSLLQVTLREKNPSFDPILESSRSSRPYGNRYSQSQFLKTIKKNSVYTVTETDVTGTCETKYAVISDKTHISSSTSEMHVTAIRDFDNCQTTPFYIQGLFQGVYVYSEEEDILDPTVETSYIITGDRTNFLIKEAKLVGKYSFRIHGLDGGSMSTFLLQTLKLKDTQPISRPITVNSPSTEKHGLLMVIPKAALIPEKKTTVDEVPTSYRQQTSGGWLMSRRPVNKYQFEEEEEIITSNEVEVLPVINHKLTEMLRCLYNPTEMKQCSELLYQVTRILREIKKTTLKSIVTKFIEEARSTNDEMAYRKSEVILDLLPTLLSPESGKVILELIREKLISELRGSLMVTGMSLVVKPTPYLIKSYLELFKETPKEPHTKVGPKTLLRRSLLLGVGTLTHTLINDMRSRGKPVPEVVSFIETISGELKRMLEESSELDKVLVIASMGNMGAVETIPVLRTLVEDTRLKVVTRISAVYALRRLAKQYKKTIIPILMSVYMDTKEDKEVRIAALTVVLDSNPGFTTLQLIGHSLRHEPSHQIKTFVYTKLVNLAVKTEHEPEHKELIQNAKLVVKSIKPVPISLYDTYTVKIGKFLDDYDMGSSIELTKYKSFASGLLDGFNFKLAGTLFGKHREILETKVIGKPFETLLRKLAGPHGLLTEILKNKVTLEELVNIISRMDIRELSTKAREIFEMFTRQTLNGLSEEERPNLYVSLKVLHHELQYLLLNQEKVHDLTKKGIELITEWYIKLTRGIKVDIIKSISLTNSLTLASPIGIPLTVNVSSSGLFKVNGMVKLNNPTSIPKMMLEVDLKPSLDVSHYVSVGVNMRWITSGVYLESVVQSDLPTKFSVHLHGPEHMITFKHYTPVQTVRVLHAKVTPHTFVTFVPTRPEKLPYSYESLEILNEKIVKHIPFETSFTCSISGIEVMTRGTYSVCGPQWCPDIPLFGKQSITIVLRPTSSVQYVHLKIKSLKSNIEWEGVPRDIPVHELFSDEDSDDEYEYESSTDSLPYRSYSSPIRKMVTPGEFDNIKTDEMFKHEPIRRQILVTVGSNTHSSPKIKGLFTWLMGRQYLMHQFNTQIVRSSYQGTPDWKIVINNAINPLELTEPETTPGDYLTKTHLTWTIGGEQKDIKIKIMPGSEFDFSQELKEHKILTAFSLPEAKGQKLKFTVETEFSHMGKHELKTITVSHDTLKYLLWNYLTTSVPTSPQHKKVIVAVELLPWWEQMNIIVKTPMENSYISKVPLYLNPLFPTDEKIKMHDVPSWVFFNSTLAETERPWTSLYDTKYNDLETLPYESFPLIGGECVMSKKHHKTFDGAIDNYFMPHALKYHNRGCNLRITETCKPNTPLFKLVTSRTSERLVVKLTIPEYEVELIHPTTESSLHVVLNGERKHLTTSNPIEIIEPNGMKVMKIVKISEKIVEVKLYEFGAKLLVDTESQEFKVKLAPWSTLQGQLCGVCGDYNYDASDDISDIFNPTTEKFRRYIKSNVMSSDTCDVERVSFDNTENYEESMIEKDITIRRYDNEIPMICKSEQKIPQCAHGYRPEMTKSIKTCFTCTPEDRDYSPAPRTYYPVPSWDEDRSVDCTEFYQRVEIPIRCVPKY